MHLAQVKASDGIKIIGIQIIFMIEDPSKYTNEQHTRTTGHSIGWGQ